MTAVGTRPGTGTNGTAGAQRIAAAFGAAAAGGRIALVPYVVAGYPDAATSLRIALAAIDAGADLLEVGLPYSDPLADGATLQRASQAALRGGATLEGSLRLIEQIAAARPATPIVPMGYANQFLGGGDGAAAAKRLPGAGAAGRDRRRPHARRGRAVRGGRPRLRPRGRLSRRADDPAEAAGRDRRAERRLPVLRLARRGDRRPLGLPARVDRQARPRGTAASPVPVASGSGSARRPTSGRSRRPARAG